MSQPNPFRRLGWYALFIATLALPTTAGADVIERTFDVAPGGTLILDTDRGSVDVRAGDDDRVHVTVERNARRGSDEEFEIRFEQRGDDVIVEGEGPERGWSWSGWNRFKVRYEIEVPRRYDLDIDTSGGSITIAELEGDVDCRTSGGNIHVADVDGRVECRTSGGGIDIGRIEGSVLAKTSGGNVTVHEVLGSIEASTSGGSVRATISRQPLADCSLRTSGGRVEVSLADSIAVDVDASTSGGRVHVDMPVLVQGEIRRTRLQGRINGGGPQLHLRTSGGSIYVKPL